MSDYVTFQNACYENRKTLCRLALDQTSLSVFSLDQNAFLNVGSHYCSISEKLIVIVQC